MGAAAAEADRTLFVGNLDPKVTEELIFELFHQAGPVIKVKIPKDRDGRPKQFAFVNFKHEESVPYGLSLLNGIKLFGRPIKIQFRSGSSHVSQDGSTAGSLHGAAGTGLSSTPHLAPNCSRYDRSPDSVAAAGFSSVQRCLPSADNLQRQAVMNSTLRSQPPFGGKYELPGYAPPGYQHPPHAFHPPAALPRRPEPPAVRKVRLSAHPYHAEGRHFGRERFGERGFEERGHHEPEHHYRGGRDEPAYDERHRDGWSHDYDYRRESYREGRWHPSRH
ncbi:RNA-binding protein 7 [Dryobates pubescens]|uniref:RNA-binding protein 7 n=1 Tax=Dryobates pubescens TaxID=118200 RepID=UPI0023B9BD8B|nr:RNA-binding protein 7 [Dryobates pubescens]